MPDQLKNIFILADLNSEILEVLAKQADITTYPQGEILIHEGDSFPTSLHAVLEGKLQAFKISASGKETILRTLSTSEMFAAPALFGDGIAVATVKALQETQVVTVAKAALLQAIQLDPEIALQILACFNTRLQEMHRTIHGLVSEQAIVRLTRLVQYSAQQYGTHAVAEGNRLNAQLPYRQIARSIGISYEESVRLMGQKLSGILSYQRGGNITILNAAALDAVAVGVL